MFLKKIIRSFLLLFLAAVTLTLLLNLLFSAYPLKVVRYFTPDDISIDLEETTSAFLPFFFNASGLSVKSKNVNIEAEKIRVTFDMKSLFSSDPFFSINGDSIILDYSSTQKREIKVKKYDWFAGLKNLSLKNSRFIYRSKENMLDLILENVSYESATNRAFVNVGNSEFRRNNITQKFNGVFRGYINASKKLSIENLSIRGSDFIIDISEGVLGKNETYGEFTGKFNEQFIKMFTDISDGRIVTNGVFDNGNLSAYIELDDIVYKDKNIKGNFDIYGNTDKKLTFKSGNISYDNISPEIKGEINPENLNTQIKFNFPENFSLFKKAGYDITTSGGKLFLSENFSNIEALLNLKSMENYTLSVKGKREPNQIKLDNITLKSEDTFLKGKGIYEDKKVDLNFSGEIINNEDLKTKLDFKHNLKVNGNIEAEASSIKITASYNNTVPSEIYNVDTKKVSGNISLNGKTFKFSSDAVLDSGSTQLSGVLQNNTLNLEVISDSVPFSTILSYFKINSEFHKTVTGKADITYDGANVNVNGNFGFDKIKHVPEHEISFSYSDKILSIYEIKMKEYRFYKPVQINFRKNFLSGNINMNSFKYKNLPEMKDITITAAGDIKDPYLEMGFNFAPYRGVKPLQFLLKGEYDNLTMQAENENIDIQAKIKPIKRNLQGKINLDNLSIDNTSISGESRFQSSDLQEYLINKGNLRLNIMRNYPVKIEKLQMKYRNQTLHDISCQIQTNHIKNLIFKDGFADKKFFKGKLKFGSSTLSLPFLKNVHSRGNISVSYDYEDYPLLNGELNITGSAASDFVNMRLDNNNIHIKFDNESISGEINSRELDTKVQAEFTMDKYYETSSLNGYLQAENLYLEKYGFRGSFDINSQYSGKAKELMADIYINRGFYSYSEAPSFDSGNNEKGFTLPFDAYIYVQTRQPVTVQSDQIKGGAHLALSLQKNKDFFLEGRISSVNTEITMANGTFSVTKGYVNFLQNLPPYLYMEAVGEDNFNNLQLKVKGYLPEYEIEVNSLNPALAANNTTFSSESGEKELMSRIFGGLLFKDVINFSEKIIGINEISVHSQNFRGESGEYLSVGKSFSDRLQLKYTVGASQGQNQNMNSVIGEYSLFDWLKLFIYTMPNGGSGAGFSVFNGF